MMDLICPDNSLTERNTPTRRDAPRRLSTHLYFNTKSAPGYHGHTKRPPSCDVDRGDNRERDTGRASDKPLVRSIRFLLRYMACEVNYSCHSHRKTAQPIRQLILSRNLNPLYDTHGPSPLHKHASKDCDGGEKADVPGLAESNRSRWPRRDCCGLNHTASESAGCILKHNSAHRFLPR